MVEDHGATGGIDYPLKLAKFQSVSSLTIFFEENFGGDFTSISYLGLKGEVTTVSQVDRQGDKQGLGSHMMVCVCLCLSIQQARHGVVECVYESAPQMADHKQKADFGVPDVAGN